MTWNCTPTTTVCTVSVPSCARRHTVGTHRVDAARPPSERSVLGGEGHARLEIVSGRSPQTMAPRPGLDVRTARAPHSARLAEWLAGRKGSRGHVRAPRTPPQRAHPHSYSCEHPQPAGVLLAQRGNEGNGVSAPLRGNQEHGALAPDGPTVDGAQMPEIGDFPFPAGGLSQERDPHSSSHRCGLPSRCAYGRGDVARREGEDGWREPGVVGRSARVEACASGWRGAGDSCFSRCGPILSR